MAETLLLSAMFAFVAAIVYAFVGRIVQTRTVTERNRLANRMFSTWWYALGFSTALLGILSVAYYFGYRDISFHFAARLLNLVVVCAALFALMFYLVFLFTGKDSALKPLAVGYGLYFFFLVYFLMAQQPVSVASDGWSTRIVNAAPETGLLYGLIIVLLLFPQIGGAFALLFLAVRMDDLEVRLRAGVVGISILVWFGTSLVGLAMRVADTSTWQIISRIIGLAAALAILLAYRPPAVIRRRLAQARASNPTSGDGQARAASRASRSSARSIPSETAW